MLSTKRKENKSYDGYRGAVQIRYLNKTKYPRIFFQNTPPTCVADQSALKFCYSTKAPHSTAFNTMRNVNRLCTSI